MSAARIDPVAGHKHIEQDLKYIGEVELVEHIVVM